MSSCSGVALMTAAACAKVSALRADKVNFQPALGKQASDLEADAGAGADQPGMGRGDGAHVGCRGASMRTPRHPRKGTSPA